MTRFATLALLCVIGLVLGAGVGRAQTKAADPDGRFSAQFTVAATLGHKSSSAFGGELDYRFNDDWDFFFEARPHEQRRLVGARRRARS